MLAGALVLCAAGGAAQPPPDAPLPPSSALTPFGAACPFDDRSPADFALVLSGGGARGFAHIGVLRVLDSLGLQPGIVVGTSMGALVGALYAGGLQGRQIEEIARNLPFESLFRRYEPISLLTAGDFTTPLIVLPPTFVLEFQGSRLRLQSPLAREPRINALFNQLLLPANLAASGDFDRLPRRFRAVATDTRTRSAVVLGDGDLAEAVRASIAIPLVFAPVERDGRVLVDGGLSDNVPVDVARRMGASSVFAVDVGVAVADTADRLETATMIAYLIDELFIQPPDSLGVTDMGIRPAVRDFNPLDFTGGAVGPLIDAGYRAAAAALRGCTASAVRTPAAPTASGGAIQRSLARFADEGVYETVWLNPKRRASGAGSGDSTGGRLAGLQFSPVALLAPERTISVGASYEVHEGARAWLAAANVTPGDGRLRAGSVLSVGEWRQQLVLTATRLRRHPPGLPEGDSLGDGRVYLPDPRSDLPPWSTVALDLVRPEVSLTGSRDVVRIYDGEGRQQHEPTALDAVMLAGVGATPVAGQRIIVGPVAHIWSTRGTPIGTVEGRAFGGMLRAARTFRSVPEGPEANTVPAVVVEAMWLDRHHRVGGHVDIPLRVGSLTIRPRGAVGWGERLPLGAQFVMGGAEGFPGLRTGERRGERFAFGALAIAQPLVGPLHLRIELGAGTTSVAPGPGTSLIPNVATGAVQGGEVGLAMDTPLGPLLIGYGTATTDRSVIRVRLGR